MLGATAVAQAPPDGYTLLVGTGSTHGTNSNVYSRINYDPVRDFVPVVLLTTSPLLLIVPPSLPVKNVSDLIALGRSRAGELSFGSYGTGSINHLGAELFNSMAKIQANHVPYRGSAPAMTDLIAGRLDYMSGCEAGSTIGSPEAMMLATLLVNAAGVSGTGVFISFRCSW